MAKLAPMKMVSIKQARDRLSELARAVEAGEHVIVTRNGKPVMQLGPPPRTRGGLNWEGLRKWKAEHGISEIFGEPSPDFDDPLPEDFLITPQR